MRPRGGRVRIGIFGGRIQFLGEAGRGNILPRGLRIWWGHVGLSLLGGRNGVGMFVERGRKGNGIFQLTLMGNKRREVFFGEGVGV